MPVKVEVHTVPNSKAPDNCKKGLKELEGAPACKKNVHNCRIFTTIGHEGYF